MKKSIYLFAWFFVVQNCVYQACFQTNVGPFATQADCRNVLYAGLGIPAAKWLRYHSSLAGDTWSNGVTNYLLATGCVSK